MLLLSGFIGNGKRPSVFEFIPCKIEFEPHSFGLLVLPMNVQIQRDAPVFKRSLLERYTRSSIELFFHGMKRDLVFSPAKVKNGQAGFDSTIETMLPGKVKNEVKNGQKMLTFIKHTTKCQQTQQSPVSKTSACLQGFTCGQKMLVK